MARELTPSYNSPEIQIPGYQVKFSEYPELTEVVFYHPKRTCLVGQISISSGVTQAYFLIPHNKEKFCQSELQSASFNVDHLVKFPSGGRHQILIDPRSMEYALDNKGLEQKLRSSDPTSLTLLPGDTLSPTLAQIEQAGLIFLLEQALTNKSPQISIGPEVDEPHSALSLLGPLTHDLVDPFKYAGLNIQALFNPHAISFRYEQIISQLYNLLIKFPENSFEHNRTKQALDHAKRSFLFANQLHKLYLFDTNSKRVTQILAMSPKDLLEQRDLIQFRQIKH